MGAGSRAKGIAFERLVAKRLREVWPGAKRGLQYQEGEHCPDIVGTPYYIECKRYAKICPWQIEQWMFHARKMRTLWMTGRDQDCPVLLITQEDRKPIHVHCHENIDKEDMVLIKMLLGKKNTKKKVAV